MTRLQKAKQSALRFIEGSQQRLKQHYAGRPFDDYYKRQMKTLADMRQVVSDLGRPYRELAGAKTRPYRPLAGTKTATLIDLLKRRRGASLAELVEVTNWQPVTVRSHISGVLKKLRGYQVESTTHGGKRTYRIVA